MLISVYLSVHIQKQMLTTSSVDIMRWMNGCMLTTSISCLYVVIMTWICLHPHVNMLTTPSWHIHLHINKLTTSHVSSACWHLHENMLTTSQEYDFTWLSWQLHMTMLTTSHDYVDNFRCMKLTTSRIMSGCWHVQQVEGEQGQHHEQRGGGGRGAAVRHQTQLNPGVWK